MTATASCDYCGLPLPRPVFFRRPRPQPAGPQFCCLGCQIASAVTRERGEQGAAQWTLTRLGLGVFFSMNVMVFTLALWAYDVYDVSGEAQAAGAYVAVLKYLALLFSLPVLFLLGQPIAESAWRNLWRGVLSTDLLLLTGVVAAYAYSIISVIRGAGAVYLEVGCVILMFVTLGRWLEATGRLRASAALERLQKLIPDTVRVRRNGGFVSVATPDVIRGNELQVHAGERFPADGTLLHAAASIDEQIFTGESWPVVKQAGDPVLGGTVNLDGTVDMTVSALPWEGTLGRMIDAVRRAREAKGAYQRLADRVSTWFFPVIAVVTAGTFAGHAMAGHGEQALSAALAVVLIACPCALGIATPLAVWAALGRAAESQVLFRSGDALERLAAVRSVCFDKTGTLTTGAPRVKKFASDPETPREEVLGRAVALAGTSSHPFSQAIVGIAETIAETNSILEARIERGRGVSGYFGDSSARTWLGSYRLVVEEAGCRLPEALDAVVRSALAEGRPVSLLGWDDLVRAAFVFDEELRPEAGEAIAECRHAGWQTSVLTGDHAQRGARIGEQLGIPVRAGLLPEDKVAAVHDVQAAVGSVAMVGDGINDAPALAAADVGIAMGCGPDVTRDSADVCLLTSDLRRVPWSIRLSRQSVLIVRQNLGWAFGYNACGVVLAAGGWLHPSIAAVLMVLSSLAVIANSLRLRRFDAATLHQSEAQTREWTSLPSLALRANVPDKESNSEQRVRQVQLEACAVQEAEA
jgi:heavy metal translocating P-type ATPase